MKHPPRIFALLSLPFSLACFATEIDVSASGIVLSDTPVNATSVFVLGPNDFSQNSESSTGTFYLDSETSLADGRYAYKMMGALPERLNAPPSNGTDGRRAGTLPTETPIGIIETGYFQLADGELVDDLSE